jgi:hypothetical protein
MSSFYRRDIDQREAAGPRFHHGGAVYPRGRHFLEESANTGPIPNSPTAARLIGVSSFGDCIRLLVNAFVTDGMMIQ